MQDDAGGDEQSVGVPVPKLRRRYARITEYSQMPEITIRQIRRFFEHDKDLEPGKWVKGDRLGRRRRGRAD
jgi:inorganic pyrophosphatase